MIEVASFGRGWRLVASALTVAALCTACSEGHSKAQPREAEIARVANACVEAMLRSTCQVMSGPMAAQAASVVFVAGVGPVDATAYRELRASGEAMCAVVRDACRKEWDGAQCKTARGLWPGAR